MTLCKDTWAGGLRGLFESGMNIFSLGGMQIVAGLILILFIFFGNRICKDTLAEIEQRKELQQQAQGEGLKSPNDAPLEHPQTLKEAICT